MPTPEGTLRVGIDHFHGTRQAQDGTETFYLATRILPQRYGKAVLQIDEVLERLLPHGQEISPQMVTSLGWRCLSGDKVRGNFMDKDAWIQAVIGRATGAVIATSSPYVGKDGEKLLPVRELASITTQHGRLVPEYKNDGELVARPKSQLYVPINPDYLPSDVSRGQFVR